MSRRIRGYGSSLETSQMPQSAKSWLMRPRRPRLGATCWKGWWTVGTTQIMCAIFCVCVQLCITERERKRERESPSTWKKGHVFAHICTYLHMIAHICTYLHNVWVGCVLKSYVYPWPKFIGINHDKSARIPGYSGVLVVVVGRCLMNAGYMKLPWIFIPQELAIRLLQSRFLRTDTDHQKNKNHPKGHVWGIKSEVHFWGYIALFGSVWHLATKLSPSGNQCGDMPHLLRWNPSISQL